MGDWEPKKWRRGKYTQILEMFMKGKSAEEIALVVDMCPDAVNKVCNTQMFKDRVVEREQKVTEKARKVFEDKAVDAAEKIVKLAKEGKPEERIQLDAAKEILHQVGLKPVDVIETRQREYTQEELESALRVTREIEEITRRLSGSKSDFLLEDPEEPLSTAPVPLEGEKSGEESGVKPTDGAGQEAVPEKPLLSV